MSLSSLPTAGCLDIPGSINASLAEEENSLDQNSRAFLDQAGIKPKNLHNCVKNPEANSVCERMHDNIGNILRVTTRTNPPASQAEVKQSVDNAIHG